MGKASRAVVATVLLGWACSGLAQPRSMSYGMDDFARVPKFDAHVHANVDDPAFLQQAREDGFELMSINVDYPDFPSIADQHAAAIALAKGDPARLHTIALCQRDAVNARLVEPGEAGDERIV